MASILVVATDPGLRERLGALLEEQGWPVTFCPGPAAPDYVCVGVRGTGCPLADDADAVVLDLDLDSDLVVEGTTAIELVAFYLSVDRPLVALAHEGVEFTHPFAEERLRVLRWPRDREVLTELVAEIAGVPWHGTGRAAGE
jgi:CheY-like chemotaxis protein